MINQNDRAGLYGGLIAEQQAQSQASFMGCSLTGHAGIAYKPPTTLELMQYDVSEILKDWDK